MEIYTHTNPPFFTFFIKNGGLVNSYSEYSLIQKQIVKVTSLVVEYPKYRFLTNQRVIVNTKKTVFWIQKINIFSTNIMIKIAHDL